MIVRFYYARQVTEEGGSPGANIDGPTHGEAYFKLYQQKEQGHFDVRFVKGGAFYN